MDSNKIIELIQKIQSHRAIYDFLHIRYVIMNFDLPMGKDEGSNDKFLKDNFKKSSPWFQPKLHLPLVYDEWKERDLKWLAKGFKKNFKDKKDKIPGKTSSPAPKPNPVDISPLKISSSADNSPKKKPTPKIEKKMSNPVSKFPELTSEGSNIPEKPIILIDSSNVCQWMTENYAVENLKSCVDFFVSRGYRTVAFMPQQRYNEALNSSWANYVTKLVKDKILSWVPSKEDDDLYLLAVLCQFSDSHP